ncbi:DapH/DapD/GlmU-related protein [Bacillus cereus]|uniref:acyltransferase n=1 Tax=Bacillus cereus TaxID=1396 RepID=UPI0024061BF1|nr:DapH/DapD/GlmU-related protein [Bacillus cereus]MDF9485100.1 DapH/DapD/GlmU-related protein [Bacillus cereus]MDF9655026.1 DapH/DapD/GlmU-related protein [Bacillus cereus]WIV93507.1 DapH/DapD/GlmU-related protein [Bacillus bombysepticus]
MINLNNFIKQKSFSLVEPHIHISGSNIKDYSWIRRHSTLNKTNIGNDVFIGFRCTINNSFIEDGCQIASRVQITESAEPTYIGKSSWIGAQAIIKGGVKIGDGVVVGARSVVTEDIPAYSIVVGNPARVLKKREVIKDSNPNFREFLNTYRKRLAERDVNEIQETMAINEGKWANFIDASLFQKDTVNLGKGLTIIGKRIVDTNGNILTDGGVFTGENVGINDHCILEAGGKITIGSNTTLGKHVHILSTGHNYQLTSLPMTFLPVEIGENVCVEDNVLILGGVKIADGVRIPANSMVLRDIKQ